MVTAKCVLNGKWICCNHLNPERPTAKESAVRRELKSRGIIDCFGWEGTFQGHPVPPPAMSRDISNQLRVLRAPSNLAWNGSRDGASPTSLGNVGQGVTTLSVNNFFLRSSLNLPSSSSKPSPLVPQLQRVWWDATFISGRFFACQARWGRAHHRCGILGGGQMVPCVPHSLLMLQKHLWWLSLRSAGPTTWSGLLPKLALFTPPCLQNL